VDLPIKNGGSFHSYVSLPEGKPPFSYGFPYVARDPPQKTASSLAGHKKHHRPGAGTPAPYPRWKRRWCLGMSW